MIISVPSLGVFGIGQVAKKYASDDRTSQIERASKRRSKLFFKRPSRVAVVVVWLCCIGRLRHRTNEKIMYDEPIIDSNPRTRKVHTVASRIDSLKEYSINIACRCYYSLFLWFYAVIC